jgi:hypothetical protein
MAMAAMFATIYPILVIYDNTIKASIILQKKYQIELLTLTWMLTIIQPPLDHSPPFLIFSFLCSRIACFGSNFSPLWNKISKKSPKDLQKRIQKGLLQT